MLHNGQEFGQDEFLPGSGPGRVVPRPLRWQTESSLGNDRIGKSLFGLYKQLIDIRKRYPGRLFRQIIAAANPPGTGYKPRIFEPDQELHQEIFRYILCLRYRPDLDRRVPLIPQSQLDNRPARIFNFRRKLHFRSNTLLT